jgi:hypothetical protein
MKVTVKNKKIPKKKQLEETLFACRGLAEIFGLTAFIQDGVVVIADSEPTNKKK